MTNWNHFICQRSTNEVLWSNNNGINTLATNIQKFSKRLKFGCSRIANEKENLLSILRANNANWASHLKDSNYQMKNRKSFSEGKWEWSSSKTKSSFSRRARVFSHKQIPMLLEHSVRWWSQPLSCWKTRC